jgi:hypothetical protein
MDNEINKEYQKVRSNLYRTLRSSKDTFKEASRNSRSWSFDHIVTKITMEILGYKDRIAEVAQASHRDGLLSFSAFEEEFHPFPYPTIVFSDVEPLSPTPVDILSNFTKTRMYSRLEKTSESLVVMPVDGLSPYGGYALFVCLGEVSIKKGSICLSMTNLGLVAHGRLDHLLHYLIQTGDATVYEGY